ncbi:MAG: FtsK/SpoIIIE domain-containing protein [Cellulomonas sp.]
MRFTLLHPDPARGAGLYPTDVEADPGTAMTALRPALSRLTGYGGWADTQVQVSVDGVVLDDHHLVGQPPLVDGCVLRVGAGRRPAATVAAHAAWHVAVVAGPDCGGLLAVPDLSTVSIRSSAGTRPPAVGPDDGPVVHEPTPTPVRDDVLVVDDPTLGHLLVRRRGDRVQVRVDGQVRWRRWRPDRPRRCGASTVVLRGAGMPDPPMPPAEPGLLGRPAAWLTPLVGSVALALALRQPLLALAGLAAPLVAVGPAILARIRRRTARDPADGPAPAPGLSRAATDGVDGPGPTSPLDPAGATTATRRDPAGSAVAMLRDPAELAVATVRARGTDAEPAVVAQPWDVGGSLAVVGPRALALPVARAVVLGALGTHLSAALTVRTRRPDDWAWCLWAADGDGPGVLVVADDPPDPAGLALWRSSAPPGQHLVVLAGSDAAVPAWCRARLEVGPRSVRLRDDSGSARLRPRHAVSGERALAQVRAAAAARAVTGGHRGGDALPERAALGALDGIPAPDRVAEAWSSHRPGLVAALGVGAGGRTLAVDLVADGPHALVAGTTGAGKSALLVTLVLALAVTHPPDRLAILLVDFKGGTGLGPVAGLPHVLEHVTDLDPTHARRVLTALRAELRRRESILAAAGARDLRDLDAVGSPPRLLVVVDELRALTEDLPDASATLTRIAAQGRALGVHLVLATQRPAGAVGADLRANVALRIALRVTDPADSTDVLDAPDAARIDPATPGRAWVRRGTRALEPVQVARAVLASAAPVVRSARPRSGGGSWTPGRASVRAPVDDTGREAVDDAGREAVDDAARWVGAAARAALRRPAGERPPWLPALPAEVRVADVPDGRGLAIAVADHPDQLRRGAVRWDPAARHLLVLGGPRSGRTTTLVTAGVGALEHGWPVHAVGLPSGAVDQLRARDRHGGLGSVLETDDARATARLLELLADVSAPAVLLVDRLDLVLESLGGLARGAGGDRLTALWRGAAGGTAVAAGADAGASAMHHAGAFAQRLVLPLADATLDALAGVPAVLAGGRSTPGRAVHVHAAGAELCQVALPDDPGDAGRGGRPRELDAGGRVTSRATGGPRRLVGERVDGPAERPAGLVLVRALPDRADLPDALSARPATLEVPLGPGGDDAGVVWVDLAHGLLVAGPPGSGRSTALEVLARTLVRSGRSPLRLLDPSVEDVPAIPGVRDVGPADLLDACRAATTPPVVLVDDLDDLERVHPSLGDVLASTGSGSLVGAVTSTSALHALRGAVPVLLRRRRVLVLDVHDPASAELVGPRAAWSVDPRRRPPGRGVLLRGRDALVVQVYRSTPGRPAGQS